MIARCAETGGLIGMDVQGLTRVVIEGEVRARAPWNAWTTCATSAC